MIKIRKSKTVPTVLDRSGNCKLTSETDKNNKAYDSDPVKYDSGDLKLTFYSDIYGHTNIKTELRNAQFGKCAFCEQNVTSVAHGDIEHFRPKKGYKQSSTDNLHYAGYYWVAYDWDNLLFACAICNQRHKGNLFPLLNPKSRAKCHHDDINIEKPVFINPAIENPRFLIKFKGPLAEGKDKRNRGKVTIDSIGLNRKGDKGISDLYEERLEYFDKIKEIYDISILTPGAQIDQAKIDKCKAIFKNCYSKKKKFFAMIKDNFPRPS